LHACAAGDKIPRGTGGNTRKAGVYHYICTVHDHMKGTVVVG
jgi:plastocyanin